MPMTQQQAAQVLRRNAPAGEFPAFINPQEASWLKGMGASGRKTKSGLRSYFMGAFGGGGSDTGSKRGRDSSSSNNSSNNNNSQSSGREVGHDRTGTGIFTARDDDKNRPESQGTWENIKRGFRDATQVKNPKTGKWEWKAAPKGSEQTGGDGGGSGGSGSSIGGGYGAPAGFNTRQNTQSSISEIDRPTHEFRQKVFDKASDVMGREYEAYEGDRFAKPAQDTLDAQQQIRDLQGQGQGVFTAGQQTGQNVAGYTPDQIQQQSFLGGQGVDQYMNPHTQNVIQNLQKNAMDTMQMQRNQLGSQAQMAGAGIGSRSAIDKGVMAAGVQRDLNQQTGDLLNKSFADASAQKRQDMEMEQARQRYNQGANMEGQRLNLAGADMASRQAGLGRQAGFQDAQMLSKVGADIEGREQNELDWDYDQAMEKRDWDKNQAMFGSNVLGGAPFGTQTQQSQPQYQNQRGGRFGSALAGAAAGSAIHPVYGTAIGAGLGWLGGGGGGLFG